MPGMLVTFGETMGLVTTDRPGSLDSVRSGDLGIGGAESNVAMAAARLGATACWIGRVGHDAFGDLIERQVTAAGVEAVVIRDDEAFTGIMVRHRPVASMLRVDYHRSGSAGSRLRPGDVPDDMVRAAAILHVTGITPALSASARECVIHAVDVAVDAGVTVSVDVNHRAKLWSDGEARPVLRDLVNRADIVFAGVAEAKLVLGSSTTDPDPGPAALAHALVAMGPREAIVKKGALGSLAVAAGEVITTPALPVVEVDPVGAGDAFVAGYLAERLIGSGPRECLRVATAMGAYSVGVPGDCQSLPTRDQLAGFSEAVGTSEVDR